MIKNLTPHIISMVNENGEVVRQYPSEGIARATFSLSFFYLNA